MNSNFKIYMSSTEQIFKFKRLYITWITTFSKNKIYINQYPHCLLYTSDAADDLLCVDLGGRRIIKKKKKKYPQYLFMSGNFLFGKNYIYLKPNNNS